MRYLGPLHFKVHAESELARQAGMMYEPLARTMIGQMLAFSGDVTINAFQRQLPDGTRIKVYMNRADLAPTFIAQVWPVENEERSTSREQRTWREEQWITPYFCVGLKWISGGELIGNHGSPDPSLDSSVEPKILAAFRERDVRAIPHLVVWEPNPVGHDIPVMVKRWTNPPRPPVWGGSGPPPGDTNDFMGLNFVNNSIPQDQLFLNYRQNAYWWRPPQLNRWRYHFFARSEAGLVVWEYDNLGRHGFTPMPMEVDAKYFENYEDYAVAPDPEREDLYLAVAELNTFARPDGRDYDEVSFTSYPFGFSLAPGQEYPPNTEIGSGWGELRLSETESLPPLLPNHPATLTGVTYLCKVVVENFGKSNVIYPIFAPLTVQLDVMTGLTPEGRPAFRDQYTLTIEGSTSARRILYPGGYYANPDNQPPPDPPPPFWYPRDFGPNIGGNAWSSETIALSPFGGSGLTDELPWGVGASTDEVDWRWGFLDFVPDRPYRGHFNIWMDDPESYGYAPD